jgi:cobalt-zinc-cadmium resistance protein CzcA
VKVEQTTGLPMLTVRSTARNRALRLNIGDVQEATAIAIGGARPAPCSRATAASTSWCACRKPARRPRGAAPPADSLPGKSGAATSYIPLSEVATLDFAPGPNQISRENGKRRIDQRQRDGRDIGSFVPEGGSGDSNSVKIPSGYWTTWGGTFEQLQSATRRLRSWCRWPCSWCSRCCSSCSTTSGMACWCLPAFHSR